MSKEDALNNELTLWERYTEKAMQDNGKLAVRLMPGIVDGPTIAAEFDPEIKPRERVQMWFAHIRMVNDEREASKEAEALSRAQASKPSSEQSDTSAGVDGGSKVPATPPVPSGQASVESILESQVAYLNRRIPDLKRQSEEAARTLDNVLGDLDDAEREKQAVIEALRHIRGEIDAPKVRRETGKNRTRDKKGKGPSRRTGVVDPELSEPDVRGLPAGTASPEQAEA